MERSVYLGGPIDGCSYGECNSWREYAIKELTKDRIIGLSPMRAKEFLREHPILVDGVSDHVLTSDSGITDRDKWDVKRAGAVLFNLLKSRKVSIGTVIEYGWADNKPIITVMEKKGNPHEHPMIRRLTSYRVETLDSGLAVARALFAY